jgi:hypothetical protein
MSPNVTIGKISVYGMKGSFPLNEYLWVNRPECQAGYLPSLMHRHLVRDALFPCPMYTYVYIVFLWQVFFLYLSVRDGCHWVSAGGRNAEYANDKLSHTYIRTSKQFNRLLRPYALNPGCSNFEFGLETTNSEDLQVSSAVFPEK